MQKVVATMFIGALGALTAGVASGETTPAGETATVWEVDTRGRPPFERRQVEVPVVDVAAMESAYGGETTTVWVVDRRGKPPFQRRQVEVPVLDAAALEVGVDADEGPVFRGRPPFRRH